uniref:Uncharacterized protein n=1 Tax=mine drainage metagenome TaxID=410659 RepID=E6QLJ2_9ZZZZ
MMKFLCIQGGFGNDCSEACTYN